MISFANGVHGAPDHRFTDESETALGAFLVGDVQTGGDWLLDMLAWAEDVRAGRSPEEDWSGNSWVAEVRPDGLHLFDTLSDDCEGHYALADALAPTRSAPPADPVRVSGSWGSRARRGTASRDCARGRGR